MQKVIVVDNEEGIRELHAELLTRESFQVSAPGEHHNVFEQLQQ